MQALMKGVRGACPACMLFWLLSNVSASGALLNVYKFYAKLLFFAVSFFRVLSYCSSVQVCLFRPEEDDVISVTSSTQSASLVISNLVPLHKPIP
jgi:hypothetical protein